jgi:hypothetical protein
VPALTPRLRNGKASAIDSTLPKFELVPIRTYLRMLAKVRRPSSIPSASAPRSRSTNASGDAMVAVLEDNRDDPTFAEPKACIDEQVDLVALAWLGRGDGTIAD